MSRLIVLAALASLMFPAASTVALAASPTSTVFYSCADGKEIAAAYYDDSVSLILNDGRAINLKQKVAASGTRYANAKETVVFWSKGDSAFVTEGGDDNQTYADCQAHEGGGGE